MEQIVWEQEAIVKAMTKSVKWPESKLCLLQDEYILLHKINAELMTGQGGKRTFTGRNVVNLKENIATYFLGWKCVSAELPSGRVFEIY